MSSASTSLDKRLEEVMSKPHKNSSGTTVMEFPTQKYIEAIKQAFIDEGWVRLPKSNGEPRKLTITYKEKSDGTFDRIKNDTFLSGPEWLARFEKELHATGWTDRRDDEDVYKAARKASGADQ